MWQHQGDGRLAVWYMRGATLLSAEPMSPGRLFNLDWKIRGVGGVNGDGDIAAWLMSNRTMMAGVAIGQVADTNWYIVGPR